MALRRRISQSSHRAQVMIGWVVTVALFVAGELLDDASKTIVLAVAAGAAGLMAVVGIREWRRRS